MADMEIPRAVQLAAAKRLLAESRDPVQPSFVAYYRVSTDRQGETRLGLDARLCCKNYLLDVGVRDWPPYPQMLHAG
jgi:hypothetical protein